MFKIYVIKNYQKLSPKALFPMSYYDMYLPLEKAPGVTWCPLMLWQLVIFESKTFFNFDIRLATVFILISKLTMALVLPQSTPNLGLKLVCPCWKLRNLALQFELLQNTSFRPTTSSSVRSKNSLIVGSFISGVNLNSSNVINPWMVNGTEKEKILSTQGFFPLG